MTEAARALVYSVAQGVGHDKRNRLGSDAAKLFAAPVGKAVLSFTVVRCVRWWVWDRADKRRHEEEMRRLAQGPRVVADDGLDAVADALGQVTDALATREQWRGRFEPWE